MSHKIHHPFIGCGNCGHLYVFLNPLTKAAAKGQLGLISEAHAEIEILRKQFPQIMANLKMYLSTFLLDNALIDDIIEGAKMGGLSVA